MEAIANAPNRFKRYAAGLALSALAVTMLAVAVASGPAQAQSPDETPTPTATPVVNTYPKPQPCGPGAGTASMAEPHEITEGHFALFDAYWRVTARGTGADEPDSGWLHTNLCPPKVTETTRTVRGQTTTTTTYTASMIDIDKAIFHVLDSDEATVVAAASEEPSGVEIITSDYENLDRYASSGSRVWWLRLDDPDTEEDETSDLSLGFSTRFLSSQQWERADGQAPLRYAFELERNPGIAPEAHPHFLAYTADPGGSDKPILVWDSAAVHTQPMAMTPGQFENLQWVFTKPGTYEISVHLIGFVKHQETPWPAGWRPISGNSTETSEVKTYTIQVGSRLNEVEPPRFGVIRSVGENAGGGTSVGEPIHVFAEEGGNLTYSLSGDEADKFALVSLSDPDRVQIAVVAGADLDYETKPTYNLTLGVSNNIDHEGNPDPRVDHTLGVQINLTDVTTPSYRLVVKNRNPLVGETVTFTVEPRELENAEQVTVVWLDDNDVVISTDFTLSQSSSVAVTKNYSMSFNYKLPCCAVVGLPVQYYTVTWRNP